MVRCKTYMLKKEQIKPKWYILDATNIPLGRLATQIAKYLTGKNELDYTPNLLKRNHIIVLNANKYVLSGKKQDQKIYYKHTGYMGGLKEMKINDVVKKHPTFPIFKAVERMINKNRTRNHIMVDNLHIYTGNEHPHVNVKDFITISEGDILNGF